MLPPTARDAATRQATVQPGLRRLGGGSHEACLGRTRVDRPGRSRRALSRFPTLHTSAGDASIAASVLRRPSRDQPWWRAADTEICDSFGGRLPTTCSNHSKLVIAIPELRSWN